MVLWTLVYALFYTAFLDEEGVAVIFANLVFAYHRIRLTLARAHVHTLLQFCVLLFLRTMIVALVTRLEPVSRCFTGCITPFRGATLEYVLHALRLADALLLALSVNVTKTVDCTVLHAYVILAIIYRVLFVERAFR